MVLKQLTLDFQTAVVFVSLKTGYNQKTFFCVRIAFFTRMQNRNRKKIGDSDSGPIKPNTGLVKKLNIRLRLLYFVQLYLMLCLAFM